MNHKDHLQGEDTDTGEVHCVACKVKICRICSIEIGEETNACSEHGREHE